MKIQPECVSCLLKRIIFEAEQSTKDPKIRAEVKKKTEELLSELYDPNECSITIATKVHKLAYETMNDKDPYKELKNRANKVANSLVPKVEELIKKSDDPLKTSMICSIIGNMLDFGIVGATNNPELLIEMFEQYLKEGLGYDDYNDLKELISKSKKILLFTDNCGEFTFDKILCREIKKFNPNVNLTLVVKGEPVLSDATMEDAVELNFSEVVDEILTTGCFAVGVDFERLPKDLEKALEDADLIICKGMANYEAFSETNYRPIAYLMRVKCTAIANSSNLPLNSSSIKLYK
jgi:uncharacterized protein with ATP-grasp and redox domains